jgi:hypothetical protein
MVLFQVHEDVIRLKVAMDLIMWEHNELAANLQAKAEDSWLSKH